jgi:transcriptional regulator with XRE-family HTH domain
MPLTPEMLKAARAALGWSRQDLAKRASLSTGTVVGFELLSADPKISTVQKLQRALERAGIEFIEERGISLGVGPGIRLRVGYEEWRQEQAKAKGSATRRGGKEGRRR